MYLIDFLIKSIVSPFIPSDIRRLKQVGWIKAKDLVLWWSNSRKTVGETEIIDESFNSVFSYIYIFIKYFPSTLKFLWSQLRCLYWKWTKEFFFWKFMFMIKFWIKDFLFFINNDICRNNFKRKKFESKKIFDAMKNFTEHCVSYKGWYCFLSQDMSAYFAEDFIRCIFLPLILDYLLNVRQIDRRLRNIIYLTKRVLLYYFCIISRIHQLITNLRKLQAISMNEDHYSQNSYSTCHWQQYSVLFFC